MCLYHIIGKVQDEFSVTINKLKEEIYKILGGTSGDILKIEKNGFTYYSIVFIFNISRLELETKLKEKGNAILQYITVEEQEIIEI